MRLDLRSCYFSFFFFLFPLFLFYDSSPASSYGHIQTSFLFFFFSLTFFFFFSASVIKRRRNMVSCFHVSLFSIFLFFHRRLVRTVHYISLGVFDALFLFYFFALGALLYICYHVAHHFYSLHLLGGWLAELFILV